MLVASLLGSLIFRRRVRGAYFAILSQALAAALVIFLIGQQGTTGGTNGLTDFQGFFGYDLDDPVNQRMVYFIVAGGLLLLLALARQLMHSRYGELLVAVRDGEERVRFLGYNPANVKLVAYVVAAGMAGLAGALFVPAVGIINPAADRRRAVDRVRHRRRGGRPGGAARPGPRRGRGGLGADRACPRSSRPPGRTCKGCCSSWWSRSCRAAWRRWPCRCGGRVVVARDRADSRRAHEPEVRRPYRRTGARMS